MSFEYAKSISFLLDPWRFYFQFTQKENSHLMWYNKIMQYTKTRKSNVNDRVLLKIRVMIRIRNCKKDGYIYLFGFTTLNWFNKIGFMNT